MNLAILALALVPQASKPDFAEELKTLQKELGDAQKAFYADIKSRQKAGEKIGEKDFENEPSKDFIPKLEALAARAKGTETELKALMTVGQFSLGKKDGEAKIAHVIDVAFERHLDSPEMERLAQMLPNAGHSLGGEKVEQRLKTIVAKSPHVKARAAAKLALAEQMMAGKSTDARKAEAKKLLASVVEEAKDTEYAKRAKGQLFELENLQIGSVAPEIVAKDQDGKDFKLSSYRGSVVVLDFWGFW